MVRQQGVSTTTVIAVVGMRRKLERPAMQALLHELSVATNGDFKILELNEDVMNGRPVHQWPIAHVLLTLYSDKFPLDKVLRYVALRSPLLVNNVHMQPLMMDRRLIRRVLSRAGVPIPPAIYLNRSAGDSVIQSGNTLVVSSPSRATTYTIEKPFVEKPVDPEDHNVYIYYKDGGVRRLFRKVKNMSSDFDGRRSEIRSNGDYIYEKFIEPDRAADVKVYAVGPSYFHAESRKAPHVDGVVERDRRGNERRMNVQLSCDEMDLCGKVVSAFDQFILGFDLLRSRRQQTNLVEDNNHNHDHNHDHDHYCYSSSSSSPQQFVIDVNGWSLVKNSPDYTRACAIRLANHVRTRLQERRALHIRALHLARPHHATTVPLLVTPEQFFQNHHHHHHHHHETKTTISTNNNNNNNNNNNVEEKNGDAVGGVNTINNNNNNNNNCNDHHIMIRSTNNGSDGNSTKMSVNNTRTNGRSSSTGGIEGVNEFHASPACVV